MIIETIRFKNYRQYMNAEIKFSLDKNKHITIIQGANGTGKTNILNAITWCLYNKEIHLGDKYAGLPIINTITLRKMNPQDTCEVMVEVVMRDEEDKRIIFKRVLSCRKIKDYEFEKRGEKFDIFYQVGKDYAHSEDPEFKVKMRFPEDIQEYFFFDCERLNEYFKSSSNNELIKREVFKISQLGLFEKVFDHLRRSNDEFSKQLKNINPEADKTKNLIDSKQEELKQAEIFLETCKKEENEAEKLEREIGDKLKSVPSSEEVRELQEKRERLEDEIKELENEVEELLQKQKDFLIDIAPLIMGYESIVEARKMISTKIDAGEIPPDYKKSFLKKLLDSGKCICLTDISKRNQARQNVEKLLKECDEISEITEELIKERHSFDIMVRTLNSFRENQIRYSKDINNKRKDIEEKSKELNRISEKIKSIDSEQIKRWEDQIQIVKSKKKEAIENIALKKSEMETIKKEISALSKKYEDELSKMKKHDELRKILLFCNKAMEAVKELKDGVMEEIRDEIEKKTRKQFFELIWKKENFKEVGIDEDYNISVLDQNGRETIGSLSAGERQVLALSFMAALNQVSGFYAPIIIDTPLGRISREPKLNIAEKLPTYLIGKQLSLLVTEEEYTEEVRKRIHNKVGKEYKIDFKETSEGNKAEVVPYEDRMS